MNEIIQTLFANIPFTISIIINLILGLIGGKILVDECEVIIVPFTMILQPVIGLISMSIVRHMFSDQVESTYGLLLANIMVFIAFILPFFIKWIDEVIWFFKRKL